LKCKHFIDEIYIDHLLSGNFVSMEGRRRKCNPMEDLSKFTSN